jgi:hypothetical protein
VGPFVAPRAGGQTHVYVVAFDEPK